jgi:TolA-binding protein
MGDQSFDRSAHPRVMNYHKGGTMPRPIRLVALAAAALGGCGATAQSVRAPAKTAVIAMEPMKIEVTRDGDGQKIEAFDAATLFERAGAALAGSRWTEAADTYDRLIRDFPDSRYAPPSYYNAGLAKEGLKDWAAAAARYRELADKHPGGKDALDALFRLGGCYAELENWAASAETFARVLEQKGLSLGDRVEAMGRRGLAQYNMKDAAAAERTFRQALDDQHKNETVERLDSDFFLALCQYYLAEISHDQFRALPVRLPEKQMQRDLEAKAEMLLVAQARYVDTARIRNPAWATAAGYQMASLYREFYDSLMQAPIPPQLGAEARAVYLEELKKTIEPLLRKAIHAHELTQQVAERNGVDNDFVRKSNEEMKQLRALLAPPDPSEPPPAAPPPKPAQRPDDPAVKRDRQPAPPPRDDYHPRVVL